MKKRRYIPVVSYWNIKMGPLPSFIFEYGRYRYKWMAYIVSKVMLKFHEIKTGSDVGLISCVVIADIKNSEKEE